jgi:septal ring factor EnvC (AmiA/AmiB activator)
VAALVAAAAFGPLCLGAAPLGDRMSRQQDQIERTKGQLAQKRNELQFKEQRTQDLRRQISETNDSISQVTATLDQLQGQVAWNQRRLAWNQVQLSAAEATLQRHNDALRRRLIDAYERGDLGYVNVLFSATSFSDFVERWDDIRYLIAANQNTVRERRAAERAVTKARTGLQSQEFALSDSLTRQQREKSALASLASQRVQLYQVADLQRRTVARQVSTLEDLSAAQEAAFEEMIRERQREEAARAAAAEQERRRAAQLAGQELPPATTPGAPGDFSWPVSGPITSPFGMRINPMTGQGMEMHPGIDIGAPMGATVTAAAGGKIIWAKPYGGYGNAIIIDHGGETSSVYGHLSQIFVAEGQDVVRGQAIGAVGCTGRCTGPHLHFEVRVNGVAVDPTGRLR